MLKHCHSARLYREAPVLCTHDSDTVSLPEGEVVKVYSYLEEGINYKSLKIKSSTTVSQVVHTVLRKYRMMDKDPSLFYLTLELCDNNPTQEGLTKKTLVLDMDNRLMEFSSCHTWFDCKYVLRMKMGNEVKIFISVLDQDKEDITIRIGEDTTTEEVIKMVLYSFQMEREPCEKYCLYEESLLKRYWRRMGRREKVLQAQKGWEEDREGIKSFGFRLKLNPEIFKNKLYYVPIQM